MRTAIAVFFGLFVLTATSCKKDYNCRCHVFVDGEGEVNGQVSVDTFMFNAKRDDAQLSCDSLNNTWEAGGNTYTNACVLTTAD